jgi:nicotinamidase-related amidase
MAPDFETGGDRGSALVVIDMLNPYEHGDAEPLKRSVRTMVTTLHDLIGSALDREIPVVYVNDNYEDWSAGREELVAKALAGAAPELVEPVVPAAGTPFVVKARHSVFYETQLEYLLRSERIAKLVLAGQVTEQCVLYSALDGYVRHFEIAIARDCIAHIHPELADAALEMMERNMRAHVAPGGEALAAA